MMVAQEIFTESVNVKILRIILCQAFFFLSYQIFQEVNHLIPVFVLPYSCLPHYNPLYTVALSIWYFIGFINEV